MSHVSNVPSQPFRLLCSTRAVVYVECSSTLQNLGSGCILTPPASSAPISPALGAVYDQDRTGRWRHPSVDPRVLEISVSWYDLTTSAEASRILYKSPSFGAISGSKELQRTPITHLSPFEPAPGSMRLPSCGLKYWPRTRYRAAATL